MNTCCCCTPECEQQKRDLALGGAKPCSNLASVTLRLLSLPSVPCRLGWGRSERTLTWSRVLQHSTNTPTGWVSCKLSFSSFSSRPEGPRLSSYQTGEEEKLCRHPGRASTENAACPTFPAPGSSPGSGEAGPQRWRHGRRWAGC